MARTRAQREPINIWPGFVDALSTLLMVFIFLLVVFILGQFFMSQLLEGRDVKVGNLETTVAGLTRDLDRERAASQDLRQDLARLSGDLSAARTAREDMVATLDDAQGERDELSRQLALTLSQQSALQQDLETTRQSAEERAARLAALAAELEASRTTITAEREKVELQLAELVALRDQGDALRAEIARLQATRDDLERQVAEGATELAARDDRLAELSGTLDQATQERLAAQAQVQTLARQLEQLAGELGTLDQALAGKQAEIDTQSQTIATLGARLNVALADKVEELSRFRSDFFGRLRGVIGARDDVRIVGDRFVFQSEVLFASGEAEINPAGRQQLAALARALLDIARDIPEDLPWVLQVDGHTDIRPISTPRFPSNWELSTARAISVGRFLISQGIPAGRIAARGLAEFQPLDSGTTEEAFRRNRRIEIKITNR